MSIPMLAWSEALRYKSCLNPRQSGDGMVCFRERVDSDDLFSEGCWKLGKAETKTFNKNAHFSRKRAFLHIFKNNFAFHIYKFLKSVGCQRFSYCILSSEENLPWKCDRNIKFTFTYSFAHSREIYNRWLVEKQSWIKPAVTAYCREGSLPHFNYE